MGVQGLRSSAIRDLLAITEQPHVISLAGGLPAAELFPSAAIAEAAASEIGGDALQYSATPGYGPLRDWIAARAGVAPASVIVTHGSQQALDLLARALVGSSDVVLPDPGYVGAIQAFGAAGARLVGVPGDRDGLRVDDLASALRAGLRPAAVYVVPNFDNPTGATLSAERRIELCRLADRYGFWVVGDDPYGELRWEGSMPPPLVADRVITLGSFSKVLCPGLRVGYAIAPPDVIGTLTLLKQAADLHTSTLSQRIVLKVVARDGFLEGHVDRLRACYRERACALVEALRREAGVHVPMPEGGMFVWASLPGQDASGLLQRALGAGVGFVPGTAFSLDGCGHRESLRMSFATEPPPQLAEGARRLGVALRGSSSEPVPGDEPPPPARA